jgi:hypothetical protein
MRQDTHGRLDVPLEVLECSAHVPRDQQTDEVPEREQDGSAWAWDESRRPARLAGGA